MFNKMQFGESIKQNIKIFTFIVLIGFLLGLLTGVFFPQSKKVNVYKVILDGKTSTLFKTNKQNAKIN